MDTIVPAGTELDKIIEDLKSSEEEIEDFFQSLRSARQGHSPDRPTFTVATSVSDTAFPISEAGVYSHWLIPYVYENRRGLDPSQFAGSPADRDHGRWYSVQADEGIYAYSVGAMIRSREHAPHMLKCYGWMGITLAVVLVSLGLFLFLPEETASPFENFGGRLFRVVVFPAVALFLGFVLVPRLTGGPLRYFGLDRHADMRTAYVEEMERYRDSGVIDEITFTRITEALERDAGVFEQLWRGPF